MKDEGGRMNAMKVTLILHPSSFILSLEEEVAR